MSNPPTIDDFITDDSTLADIDVTSAKPATAQAATEAQEADQATDTQTAADDQPEAQEGSGEATDGDSDDEPEDQARAARLARELREQRRRLRQQELELAALRGQRELTRDETIEVEVNRRLQQAKASDGVPERSEAILTDGNKEYGAAFGEALKDLADGLGQAFQPIADALLEVPNAHKVIMHLADNPDVADRLATMPWTRMGVALAKEAAKLDAPKPKPKSNAPKPIKPIATTGTTSDRDPKEIDDWMTKEQDAFIKSMGYGH